MARLERAERCARLMDSVWQIPGTGIRLGLDPVIGLIPGIGDVVTSAVGAWIIYQCARAGVRKRIVLLMAALLLADFLISEIPVLGDGADVFLRANVINARIARAELSKRGLVG
jgi:hypothetical protein